MRSGSISSREVTSVIAILANHVASAAATTAEGNITCMVSSSCICEGFKVGPEVDMESLSEERSFVAHQGNLGESWDMLMILYHLSPGHGPLLGWDAGWIFGQNIVLETMRMVLVVTEETG